MIQRHDKIKDKIASEKWTNNAFGAKPNNV